MIHRLSIAAAWLGLTAGMALSQTVPFEMPRADDPPPATVPAPPTVPALPTVPVQPDASVTVAPGALEGFLNDLLSSAQPHLEGLARDMGGVVEEYRPVLEELGNLMDDVRNYDLPPERLPNGDILIRRKAGAPPPPPLEQLPGFLPRQAPPDDPVVITPQAPQTSL